MAPSRSPMPTLFVSHGAPDIVLRDMAARDFLISYSGKITKPKAIVMVSAHFETNGVSVVTDPNPGMTYDFGGFDPRLREIIYRAPGEPAIAERAAGLLEAAGFAVDRVSSRGFDHGVWTPLALLFPDADIPVVQMSVSPHRDAAWHFALGQAIEPLRDEGVLIVGSGAVEVDVGARARRRRLLPQVATARLVATARPGARLRPRSRFTGLEQQLRRGRHRHRDAGHRVGHRDRRLPPSRRARVRGRLRGAGRQ